MKSKDYTIATIIFIAILVLIVILRTSGKQNPVADTENNTTIIQEPIEVKEQEVVLKKIEEEKVKVVVKEKPEPKTPSPVVTKPTPVKPPAVVGDAITDDNILNGINTERYNNGLVTLKRNSKLDSAAKAKLDDMIKEGYFAHTSPSGKDPWYWVKQTGYVYSYSGENLASNFTDVNSILSAWMKSPLHKANILKEEFRETGIAVETVREFVTTKDGVETKRINLVVQIFANQ